MGWQPRIMALTILFNMVKYGSCHVIFMHPLSRASVWRKHPEQAAYHNYDDNALFCGGAQVYNFTQDAELITNKMHTWLKSL